MPLTKKTVQHVYEVTFRFISDRPLDNDSINDIASDIASGPPRVAQRHEVSIREMCFDKHKHEFCLMTEGHRGQHEGPSGKRWGSDR